MMSEDVSIGVKSRISAFEAMASTKPTNPNASKSAPSLLDAPLSPTSKTYFPIAPSTPATSTKSLTSSPTSSSSLSRKTSLIDLKDWVLDDGPLPYAPRQKKPPPPRPGVDGDKVMQRHVSDSVAQRGTAPAPPLIHLESPPRPPLPPRKPSYNSLRSVSLSNSSTSSLARSPSAPAPPLPPPLRKKSDSLTVDHAYPPLSKLGIAIPSRGKNGSGHVPASSIGSFHSVSLSSDGGDVTTPGSLTNFVATFPIDREEHHTGGSHEHDTISLDESFENVSASSVVSPSVSSVSTDWTEFIRRPSEPPKLPQRPKNTSSPSHSTPQTSSASPSVAVTYAVRPQSKPTPPPPPPRRVTPSSNRSSLASTTASSSDHSSIISNTTSRSSLSSGRPVYPPKHPLTSALAPQLARPTPIPPTARRRYEKVFIGNMLAQRRAASATERVVSPPPGRRRQAAGWRGLSVDLITNPEEIPKAMAPTVGVIDEEVSTDERLSARVVALIWKTSKLERTKLRSIWKECDPEGRGSLDREAFIKGMWRIDEELRKAQLNPRGASATRPPRGYSTLLR